MSQNSVLSVSSVVKNAFDAIALAEWWICYSPAVFKTMPCMKCF